MSNQVMVIRADADARIGFGHVMRCLALAQFWRDEYGAVIFVCQSLAQPLAKRLRDEKITVLPTRAPIGSTADAAELRAIAIDSAAAAVVLDGYEFGSGFQKQLRGGNYTTVIVDDYAHLQHYHADLIVNQNAGLAAGLYRRRLAAGDVLLGPKYALLRKELLSTNHLETEPPAGETRLLITLGGFDVVPLTQTLIDALQVLSSQRSSLRIKLLSHLPGLKIQDPRIDLVPFAGNMAKLYRWADLAVCAGGSTNWEMSYFGIPRLVIVLAENQRGIAAALQDADCCINAGWHESLTSADIQRALQDLLQTDLASMRTANRLMVDGQGAGRVAQRILATGK